jgi:hypothetical protein
MTLYKELCTVEYEFLEDALDTINADFGTWELKPFEAESKSGCGSCVAK